MKKLFTLLFIAPFLFSACGDDEEDPKTTPYFNPVEGEWILVYDDIDSETRVFTKDFSTYSVLILNGIREVHNWGEYSITKQQIIYKKSKSIHEYKITNDTLWFWVKGKEPDWREKYIRVK